MLGLLTGAVATLATPSAVLLAALLAPSIAVCLLDTRPGRPALRPVLLCGLAATIHPVMALWQGGHTMQVCMSLAGNTSVLATAWAAQAGAVVAGRTGAGGHTTGPRRTEPRARHRVAHIAAQIRGRLGLPSDRRCVGRRTAAKGAAGEGFVTGAKRAPLRWLARPRPAKASCPLRPEFPPSARAGGIRRQHSGVWLIPPSRFPTRLTSVRAAWVKSRIERKAARGDSAGRRGAWNKHRRVCIARD